MLATDGIFMNPERSFFIALDFTPSTKRRGCVAHYERPQPVSPAKSDVQIIGFCCKMAIDDRKEKT